jgi:hypothetical protein
MARHILTTEERRRGGITRAAQPSMQEARSKGFERTCDTGVSASKPENCTLRFGALTPSRTLSV